MRHLHAFLHAMRIRRIHRPGPDADRLDAGDRPGATQPGLADLLDAARAPATQQELAGEKAAVAAFTAARRRAAPRRTRLKQTARATAAEAVTALALLAVCGTAAVARTGNLPAEAQQHAHRLFSALGVPAPRTGPTQDTSPTPGSSRRTSPAPRPPGPAPTPGASHSGPAANPSVTPTSIPLGWCRAWQAAPSHSAGWHRQLSEAAGGPDKIGQYCAGLGGPTSPVKPSKSPKESKPAKPSKTPKPPKESRSPEGDQPSDTGGEAP